MPKKYVNSPSVDVIVDRNSPSFPASSSPIPIIMSYSVSKKSPSCVSNSMSLMVSSTSKLPSAPSPSPSWSFFLMKEGSFLDLNFGWELLCIFRRKNAIKNLNTLSNFPPILAKFQTILKSSHKIRQDLSKKKFALVKKNYQ